EGGWALRHANPRPRVPPIHARRCPERGRSRVLDLGRAWRDREGRGIHDRRCAHELRAPAFRLQSGGGEELRLCVCAAMTKTAIALLLSLAILPAAAGAWSV